MNDAEFKMFVDACMALKSVYMEHDDIPYFLYKRLSDEEFQLYRNGYTSKYDIVVNRFYTKEQNDCKLQGWSQSHEQCRK